MEVEKMSTKQLERKLEELRADCRTNEQLQEIKKIEVELSYRYHFK
jgi:hypothetical protein